VIGEGSTSPTSSLLTRPKDQYTSTLLATTIRLAMPVKVVMRVARMLFVHGEHVQDDFGREPPEVAGVFWEAITIAQDFFHPSFSSALVWPR